MKLYYSKGSCSLAVRITIHELDIPCEFERVDLKEKTFADGQDYLKINLKGYVPSLELDSGEILTENVAIQLYLADKYQGKALLPPLSDVSRYHVIEWLSYVSTELHKSCSPLFNPNVPADIKENIFKPILENKIKFLDNHFRNNTYLVGNQFTLPDGYAYVILTWMHHFNIELTRWPQVERYFNQIKLRASVQKSLAEGG